MIRAGFLLSLVLVSAGCSRLLPGVFPESPPAWIGQGSGLYEGVRGKGFYGVGVVSGIQDVGLRREAADVAARVDLAKALKSTVRNLLQSHASATSGDEHERGERYLESTTRALTEAELVDVPVIARHRDLSAGVEYALVMMTPQSFERHLSRAGLAEEGARVIRERAQEAFRKLGAPK
jgi:hypothetical protein